VLDNTGRYKGAVQVNRNDDGSEGSQISKDSFRRLFADGGQGEALRSQSRQDQDFGRNVEQLFELLDVDKNDYLDREELAPQRRKAD